MRLVIADDSNFIRSKIARAATTYGLEVVGTAKNGQEAAALALTAKPDIMTMDITMPEMDGIDAIRRIRAVRKDVLILVVSALADKATAIQALKEGAQGFLCKPFSEADFTEAIGELLKGRK
jgi:two-component system, chemotaxis family, chemotaxis protein CheY